MILWLETLWHMLLGWSSLYFLIGAGAVVIAVLEPPIVGAVIPNLRTTAIMVAITAFFFTSVAGTNYHDGLSDKQAQWDAAIDKANAERDQRLDAADQARKRVDDCRAAGGLWSVTTGNCAARAAD